MNKTNKQKLVKNKEQNKRKKERIEINSVNDTTVFSIKTKSVKFYVLATQLQLNI